MKAALLVSDVDHLDRTTVVAADVWLLLEDVARHEDREDRARARRLRRRKKGAGRARRSG